MNINPITGKRDIPIPIGHNNTAIGKDLNNNKMNYVKGDLIDLALNGEFDVITHGCNCWNNMRSGIAVPMSRLFDVHEFPQEQRGRGDYNKLGTIEYQVRYIDTDNKRVYRTEDRGKELYVVNSYTQYSPGRHVHGPDNIPLDYEALRMCFRKIDFVFGKKGLHLGIPQIGAGLALGEWDRIEKIIDEECKNIKVTCVIWDKK